MADPNELLQKVRRLADEVKMQPAHAEGFQLSNAAYDLVTVVEQLDEHLRAGGKPPTEWVEGPDAPEMDDGGGRFPYPHPDDGGVTVVGEDGVGLIAESDGFRYYLTPCCLASAKGSVNSSTGVACRRCYAEVDAELGGVPGVSGPAVFRVTLPEATA